MVDLPKTPAEKQLEELRRLKRRAGRDAFYQQLAREELEREMHCGAQCPYPDKCLPKRVNWHGCLLRQLTWRVDSPWWKKLLGQPDEPAKMSTLDRIRSSIYYDTSHEPVLQRIKKTGRI